jgi:hypothetical protein
MRKRWKITKRVSGLYEWGPRLPLPGGNGRQKNLSRANMDTNGRNLGKKYPIHKWRRMFCSNYLYFLSSERT